MEKILRRTHNIRKSRRYAGFFRVHNIEYLRALLRVIREDAKDLVKMMHLEETLNDLERRINEPEEFSAACRITRKILDSASAKHSTQLTGDEFNLAAEKYYREKLKKKHMREGFDLFACALKKLDSWTNWRGGLYNRALLKILNGRNAADFLAESEKAVLDETLSSKLLEQLIHLMLLVFYQLNQQCIQANHD